MEPVPEDLGEVEIILTSEQRADLREIYDNDGETRNTDIIIRWAIVAVMFTINSALLPFGFDRAAKGEPLGIWIGFIELEVAFWWLLLETRMERLIQYWDRKLSEIENILRPIVRVFGGEFYVLNILGACIRTHFVLLLIIGFFGFLGMGTMFFAYGKYKQSIASPTTQLPVINEQKREEGFRQLVSKIEELQRQVNVLSQQVSKPAPAKRVPKLQRGERK